MGFTCVLSMRIPALKEVSLTGPRWPSQQVVERGLAAGQGPHCTPASCLSSQCMPSALGRVPHRCSDVKLLPSSLCICMLRVFKMVLPSELSPWLQTCARAWKMFLQFTLKKGDSEFSRDFSASSVLSLNHV